MKKLLVALALFLASPAIAQQNRVDAGAFAIGRGAGVSGYTSLLCSAGQIAVGQAGAPICRTVSGDWTLNAAGVATLATVNANVGSFGSAVNCVTFTVNAKGLVTAASQTTCVPGAVPLANITGLGTGVPAALAINIGSAGAPVVFNGALGTPSSGVGTNLTALNASNLGSGTLPAARTNGHLNGEPSTGNAAAGEIGEYLESNIVSGSAVALTSGSTANVTSITLTAGDWDLSGSVVFNNASTTSFTTIAGGASTTSATFQAIAGRFDQIVTPAVVPNTIPLTKNFGPFRFSLSGSQQVFLVAFANFSASTASAYGLIRARRAR